MYIYIYIYTHIERERERQRSHIVIPQSEPAACPESESETFAERQRWRDKSTREVVMKISLPTGVAEERRRCLLDMLSAVLMLDMHDLELHRGPDTLHALMGSGAGRRSRLGIHQKGVQSEGGAVDRGSIIE